MSGIGHEVRGSRHCRSQRKIIGNNKCSNFDNDFRFFLWRNKRRELYGSMARRLFPHRWFPPTTVRGPCRSRAYTLLYIGGVLPPTAIGVRNNGPQRGQCRARENGLKAKGIPSQSRKDRKGHAKEQKDSFAESLRSLRLCERDYKLHLTTCRGG